MVDIMITINKIMQVSQVIEIILWGVKISYIFWPKLSILQGNYGILRLDILSGPQNLPKLDFKKAIFYDKNHLKFSKIDFHLGKQLLGLLFFDRFYFQTFYFLQLCPIYIDLALYLSTKRNYFLEVLMFNVSQNF